MGVQGIPSLVDMKIPKECYFSFIAAKVFSKIHLYIPVVLVTPNCQSGKMNCLKQKLKNMKPGSHLTDKCRLPFLPALCFINEFTGYMN